METLEKSGTSQSQTLIEESRGLSFCNSNGNGGSDSVLVKCSSLVSNEAPQIKELSLANGNNVVEEDALVVSENGNNANGELDKDGVVGFKEGALLEKVEALEDGISLVVEIHGSPNNHTHNSVLEVVDVKENCDKDATSGIGTEVLGDEVQKQMCEENCSRNSENEKSPRAEIEKFPIRNSIIQHEEQIKSEEEDEEELDKLDDRDYKFSVGEFVWAKTLNRPWWPGQVYAPSDASKDIAMYYRKDRVLVAFFGDEASAWCYPSLVKPFQRNFRRMSMNGNSTSFHSGMGEALCRVGKYMESEWTCSCVSLKTQTQIARPLASNLGIKDGVVVPQGRIAGLSVTEFEPAKFISRLRGIAEVVSEISLLERTAFQSQLLAFNRVNGWRDLHIYLDLQESSACCRNVGDATTNDFDFKGLTGESVVKTFQEDCPSLTVSNGIGKSSEKISQKRRRSRNVYSPLASRKRKKHKSFEVVINAEDGSNNGIPVSSPKELEKADPSGSPSAFSDSKDTTLHNDEVSTLEGNGNGFLSRDRKKSKYLSPPYTMMSPEYKSLNSLKDSVPNSPKVLKASHGEEYIASFGDPVLHSDVTISKNQSDGKNQWNVKGKVDVSEFLFEFYSAALDPMHLKKSRKNECVKGFFLNLRSYRHLSDQTTNESCAVGKDMEEDATFHSPQRISVDTPLGLPEEHLHKTESLKSAGDAKRKGRHWKEDARSQIPQSSSDIPLGSSGEDIQNKLFDVKVGLPGALLHKTDQPQSEGGVQKRGRKRKKDAMSESCQIKSEQASCTTNKETKEAIGESSSATLLLNFAPGVPLPTKEDVITQFRRFGDLNELETDVMKDSSCARIVYNSKSNAEEAYNSSKKISPFGAAVVSYELQYSTANSKASTANSQQRIPTLLGGNVVIPLSAVPPTSEAPPLEVVRRNLESMTSMLEKAGDLSPEVKANLESEIKRLLNRVGTMV
ncbi:Serine/threonine-protein kinase ATM [Thalictrum thalictroides]|uniref:Serine/threonine-protein kinase ATM n=1 Tax=Thalictrum thalictroides TaxID=46969 RepID=A0A7J6XFE7_THATH|nr:Serine/threonine-protein kinase ATM [Thalictrum thalictroides]